MVLEKMWRVRRLEERENFESFTCGEPDLDEFLINDSFAYREKLLSVTYVLEMCGEVKAYFSIANDKISINDFSNKTEFNRFRKKRFVNDKRLRSYPAVKICRFAVSESVKNSGIGSRLLNIIKMLFRLENKSGCRFITVDAYLSAIPFYERNGFLALQQAKDESSTNLLFYDLINVVS